MTITLTEAELKAAIKEYLLRRGFKNPQQIGIKHQTETSYGPVWYTASIEIPEVPITQLDEKPFIQTDLERISGKDTL